MDMRDMTLDTFQKTLSSKAAVPGGGGAAALAAALGVSLGSMVGELTLGKPRYAPVQEEMTQLTQQAKDLADRFLSLIDEDAQAFLPLSRAYAIPREQAGRAEEKERCLRLAIEPPREMVRLCCRSISLLEKFAVMGSSLAVSDAAAGAALCRGALWAAAVNVKVNTKSLSDRAYADEINRETDQLTEQFSARADRLYDQICSRY